MNIYNNIFLFLLCFNIFKFVFCSFRDIKKISDNGDYFVISDNGLFIYNFENSICDMIKQIDLSQLSCKRICDYFMISNIYKSESGVIKIAVLINQYLYIYTNDNLTKSLKKINIKNFFDDEYYIHPFNIEIDNDKLTIYYLQNEKSCKLCKGNIMISFLENYSSIESSTHRIKKVNKDFHNNIPEICQFDYYNSLIKCIYKNVGKTFLKYLVIKKDTTKVKNNRIETHTTKVYDNKIETQNDVNQFTSFTFAFSSNMNLFCYLIGRKKEISCHFKTNSEKNFKNIKKNHLPDSCDEIITYFFRETNQFILYCEKKNSDSYEIYKFKSENCNFLEKEVLKINDRETKYLLFINTENKY